MGTRTGQAERARQRAEEDDWRVRREISRARRGAGLSCDAVGAACGISGSAAWRIERGITRTVDLRTLACLGSVVGRDIRLQAFAAGDAIRDAGQIRLLERLRLRLHPDLGWRTEVPIPIANDRRAWDAVIRGSGWLTAVEAETVLDDLQAVERRIALKQRTGTSSRSSSWSPKRLAIVGRSGRLRTHSPGSVETRGRPSGRWQPDAIRARA
jgi:transcriptional regulator with XRE-family HTH domain